MEAVHHVITAVHSIRCVSLGMRVARTTAIRLLLTFAPKVSPHVCISV